MSTWETEVNTALEALNNAWFVALEHNDFAAADEAYSAYTAVYRLLPTPEAHTTDTTQGEGTNDA